MPATTSPDAPTTSPAAGAPTRARTSPRRRLVRLGGALLTVTMSLALVVFVSMTVLRFSGGELLAIRTGSMRPSMQPGDLLVARKVDPRTVRRGDVITVRVPSADNVLVTHRVTKVAEDGNSFTTKGDANDQVDPFTTKAKDVLGTKWFSIPKVGRAMVFLASGLGTALLILVPASIYLGQTLVDRRAARRAAEQAAARAAAGDGPGSDPGPAGDADGGSPPAPPGPRPDDRPPSAPQPPPFPPAAPLPQPPPFPQTPPFPQPFPPAGPVAPAWPVAAHAPWTVWAGWPGPSAPWPAAPIAAAPAPPVPPQVIVVQVPPCTHPAHPGPAAPPAVDLRRSAPPLAPHVPLPGGTTTPLAVAVDQLPPEVSERLGSQWALICPIDASVAASTRLTQEH